MFLLYPFNYCWPIYRVTRQKQLWLIQSCLLSCQFRSRNYISVHIFLQIFIYTFFCCHCKGTLVKAEGWGVFNTLLGWFITFKKFVQMVIWASFCISVMGSFCVGASLMRGISYVEALTPNITVFGDRTFKERIKIKWGPKGRALIQ